MDTRDELLDLVMDVNASINERQDEPRRATRDVITRVAKNIDVNLLVPTGYMLHHQFNIQQLYALPTLYLCVLYLSENKQRLVPLTA